MKINHLAVVFLGASTSAPAESSHSKVNESLHSSSYFHLGGTKTAAMDATLTEKEFSGEEVGADDVVDDESIRVIEKNPPEEQGIRPESEWGDRVKEGIYNTQHDNEGPADKTDDNEDLKTEVDAKAKIQADKEGELRELRAENEALKARLAEMESKNSDVESKNSWANINKIDVVGYLGVIGTFAWAFRHAATPATPATATKFACNTVVGVFPWVNQFADPVCDTLSYGVHFVTVNDEVIDLN